MAPEQVEGRIDDIDGRSDIFSFGATVYEMLTGKKAFEGKSAASVMSKIMQVDPPAISSLDPPGKSLPPALDRVVKKCLAKEQDDRWQSARDLHDNLEWIKDAASQIGMPDSLEAKSATPAWKLALPWAVAAILSIAVGFAVWMLRTPAPQPSVARLQIGLPATQPLGDLTRPAIAVSPDATRIAYVARDGATKRLFIRELDTGETRALPGTEGAGQPFFSPDGLWLGFYSDDAKLKKVAIAGGLPIVLCIVNPDLRGATWTDQGTIIFNSVSGPSVEGLNKVSASGGNPEPLTAIDSVAGEIRHVWPQLLPGGTAILFTIQAAGADGSSETRRIAVQNLQTGKRTILINGGTYGRYLNSGHLVYFHDDSLMAAPFDLRQLEISGDSVPVLTGITAYTPDGGPQISISEDGFLAYIPGESYAPEGTLVWVDRQGVSQPVGVPSRPYSFPRLSPDNRSIALGIDNAIWVYSIQQRSFSRLTFGDTREATSDSALPVWSPDGKKLVFGRAGDGTPNNPFWKAADGSGTEERLARSDILQSPRSWSPDGNTIASRSTAPDTGLDIWLLPLAGDRKLIPFLRTRFNESAPQFSPDGKWMVYISDVSGRTEIYVQPFPGGPGKWQVSNDGGGAPVWARNGELFYYNGKEMKVVQTKTSPTFSASTPEVLFEGEYVEVGAGRPNYDVTSDGQRFIMVQDNQQSTAATQINVVLNWFEELKQKVPVK